jgi:multidrug resistance efflux pump
MIGDPSAEHAEQRDPMPMLDDRAGFSALDLARPSSRIRRLAKLLFALSALSLLALAFLPWQQFVQGSGRVVAYNPLERSVTIEAPLAGRVERALVVEGQRVRKDELLFEIADNDPNLLANLGQQRQAAAARRDAARERVRSLASQIEDLQRAVPLAVEAAKTRLDAAEFASITAQQQFERVQALFEDRRGLASQRDYELARLERDRAATELARAKAELERAEVDLRASLSGVLAARDAANADLAGAEQALVALDIQVNQTRMQRVAAPRDGVVFRVQATEGTFLRAGSPLCTIIPSTANRMVELWLNGNDMPLVRPRETDDAGGVVQSGSAVRLQFEGWPAIQFVGWPSAAIGTFGGEVLLVDPTDNGKGMFRVLVAEKPDVVGDDGEQRTIAWPGDRWLRQGVRANGWILLERVPLWFEVWRRMNGFPPTLSEETMEKQT